MITDYIGGEGSAETPKNDYVIYGWPLTRMGRSKIHPHHYSHQESCSFMKFIFPIFINCRFISMTELGWLGAGMMRDTDKDNDNLVSKKKKKQFFEVITFFLKIGRLDSRSLQTGWGHNKEQLKKMKRSWSKTLFFLDTLILHENVTIFWQKIYTNQTIETIPRCGSYHGSLSAVA